MDTLKDIPKNNPANGWFNLVVNFLTIKKNEQ